MAEWKPGDRVWDRHAGRPATVLGPNPIDPLLVRIRYDGAPYGVSVSPLELTELDNPPATGGDPVAAPPHYTRGSIETIDYIEDKGLDYHLGNAVKYISRAGHKDPDKTVEDLRKAIWYIARKIKRLETPGV